MWQRPPHLPCNVAMHSVSTCVDMWQCTLSAHVLTCDAPPATPPARCACWVRAPCCGAHCRVMQHPHAAHPAGPLCVVHMSQQHVPCDAPAATLTAPMHTCRHTASPMWRCHTTQQLSPVGAHAAASSVRCIGHMPPPCCAHAAHCSPVNRAHATTLLCACHHVCCPPRRQRWWSNPHSQLLAPTTPAVGHYPALKRPE
jgi:hypothetical protein